jgi:uncharacterized protein (TIGR00369 family)
MGFHPLKFRLRHDGSLLLADFSSVTTDGIITTLPLTVKAALSFGDGGGVEMEQPLPYYRQCFVCGETRLGRLGVRFKKVDNTVRATFTPTEKHVGYPGIVHGGIITALLDEAMVWAVFAVSGQFAVSAELTVRFLKPLAPGQTVHIVGYVVRQRRHLWEVASEIQDENAVVYARAWGRMVTASSEQMQEWQSALQPKGTSQP